MGNGQLQSLRTRDGCFNRTKPDHELSNDEKGNVNHSLLKRKPSSEKREQYLQNDLYKWSTWMIRFTFWRLEVGGWSQHMVTSPNCTRKIVTLFSTSMFMFGDFSVPSELVAVCTWTFYHFQSLSLPPASDLCKTLLGMEENLWGYLVLSSPIMSNPERWWRRKAQVLFTWLHWWWQRKPGAMRYLCFWVKSSQKVTKIRWWDERCGIERLKEMR